MLGGEQGAMLSLRDQCLGALGNLPPKQQWLL